eukprot:8335716-Heterocapsa_arctica.AAC.1
MVENHKDKTFQQKEEKKQIGYGRIRKLDHTKDKEELDRLHKYVDAGILQQIMQEDTKLTGEEIDQDNE